MRSRAGREAVLQPDDLILQLGYAGLFGVAFLSATLLPLGSELAVALMPRLGYDAWLVLGVATARNYLGALTNYALGRAGVDLALSRFVRPDAERARRLQGLLRRYGAPVLVLSWLPVVGDPLTVVGGMAGVPVGIFSFWVILGKVARYAVVLGLGSPFLPAG